MASHANTLDIDELQHYVDTNGPLHDALGVSRETLLTLTPFAQGEYNVNFAFEVPTGDATPGSSPSDNVPLDGFMSDSTTPDGTQADTPREKSVPRRLLLRVNLGSQMHLDDQIGYEFEALRLLEPSGRTPRPLYVDDSRSRLPYGVGVEEWLPGRPLRYETDLAEAARILADVHAVPLPASPESTPLVAPPHPIADIARECAEMYAVYQAWSQADPQVLHRIDALFARVRTIADDDLRRPEPAWSRRHIVNTEVNSSNFLIEDAGDDEMDVSATGGAGESATTRRSTSSKRGHLVDWEKPVLGEVEQDLAHFLAPTTTFWKTDVILTRAQVDEFVDLYAQAVDGRFPLDGLRERLGGYLTATCLRGVTWCAMALTEYSAPGRAVTNADTLAKIQDYLTPGFLDGLLGR